MPFPNATVMRPSGLAVRIEPAPKFSLLLISCLMGAAIPLILALYWYGFALAPESIGGALRVSVLGLSVLLALFWYRAPLTHAEVTLLKLLATTAALWLIPTLTAHDPSHALAGWAKMLVLYLICLCMTRGLRHQPTAIATGISLLVSGLLLTAFILLFYLQHVGAVMPTYKTAREFKGIAALLGVPLNSIAFAAVFSYLAGLSLIRANRLILWAAIPLFATSSMFTGSRAPLVILGAALFLLICINGFRNRAAAVRIVTALVLVAVLVTGVVVVLSASDKDMNAATEGRSHLWSVGLKKFTERPLFGYGYESWRDDLVSRLPGEYDLTFDLAKSLGGAYHNEYVTLLAEEGLIGGLAGLLIVWCVLRSSWLLSFRQWATVNVGQWPLFAALFLLLRANFEVPGLFGFAQDPVDYLAYIFLAILLSRFSIEEDFARSRPGEGALITEPV